MFEVIEVLLNEDGEVRKAFINVLPELTSFKDGERVLPAMYANEELVNVYHIFFKKRHEPGERMWKEGGYECIDSTGGFRAFFLDALIKYPTDKEMIKKAIIKPKLNLNPQKRGRKRLFPLGESPQEIYQKQLEERRAKGEVVTRGRKKGSVGVSGRPRKYKEGESPFDVYKQNLESRREGGEIIKRGRPKVNKI